MAVLFYPKNQILARKDSSNPLFEQLILGNNPDIVIYFDTSSYGENVSSSFLYITSSWALTASVTQLFLSNSATSSCVVGGFSNVPVYQLSSGYSNTYTSSFTMSYIDDGKLINMTSGSASVAFLTSSLSPTFNAMFYQSGSGAIVFTGSGVVIRNRSGQTGSAGQYAMVTLIRVPNGDFVIGGDTA